MTSDNRGKLSQFLNETLLPALCAEQVFIDPIHRFHKSGDKWRGACPWHKSASGTSFTVTPGSKLWWCQGCHIGGGPVQYLWRLKGGTGTPYGKDFVNVLDELAALVGLSVPKAELSPEEIDREQKRETRRSILQAVMAHLQAGIPEAASAYLLERGFDADAVKDLGAGFYSSSKDVAEFLKAGGYDLKAAAAAGVLWSKWEGFIIFPWADEYGRPLTLYGTWQAKKPPMKKDVPGWKADRDRAFKEWNALPEAEKTMIPWEEPRVPKKLALPNPKDGDGALEHSKRVPLYFDRARRAGHKHVVLVEGVTDAALAQVKGDTEAIACVAAGFSQDQVQTLKRAGIEKCTIALDPDDAGERGVSSCVRMLEEAGIKPLIAPKLPDGLDPDEFILRDGIDAWRSHIDAAKTPIEREIESIAARNLDSFKLADALKPVVQKLVRMEPIEAAAYVEYLKQVFKSNAEVVKAIPKQVQAIRKELQSASGQTGRKQTSLESLQSVRRIHPAIDFHEDFMTLGFRVDRGEAGDGLLLVVSDGKSVEALVDPEEIAHARQTYRVKSGAPPFLNDTWALDKLRGFAESAISVNSLFGDLKGTYRRYLDLLESVYGLMAAWTVGTYFAHLFTAFPFLHFHGPKECGKSKTLEALRCVCFNAWKGRDISAAALGDTCDGLRGTILLDQAETMAGDSEREKIIGLLADSYKKAGARRRVVEVTKTGRNVLEFSCYGAKAFASTKPLDPDLADRCMRIPMTRTRKKLPDLEGWEPIWAELRDKLCRFTLTRFKDVSAHYRGIEATGTRIGELWRPIQAVLVSMRVDQAEIQEIKGLFTAGAEEGQHQLTGWESILFEVLRQEAGKGASAFEMTSEHILSAMNIQGDNSPGEKWVGNTLALFSLPSKKSRKYADNSRTKKLMHYQFDSAHVLRLYEIYLRETPINDLAHMSQAKNSFDSSDLHGTHANPGTCQGMSQPKNGSDSAIDSGRVGHMGTCPTENICLAEGSEILADSYLGPMGPTKSGGMSQEKIIDFPDSGMNPESEPEYDEGVI